MLKNASFVAAIVVALCQPALAQINTGGAGSRISYRNPALYNGGYAIAVTGVMVYDSKTGTYGAITAGLGAGFNPLWNSVCNGVNPNGVNGPSKIDSPAASNPRCSPQPASASVDACVSGVTYEQAAPVLTAGNGCGSGPNTANDVTVVMPESAYTLALNNPAEWSQIPSGLTSNSFASIPAYGATDDALIGFFKSFPNGGQYAHGDEGIGTLTHVYMGPTILGVTANTCTFQGPSAYSSNLYAHASNPFTLSGTIVDLSSSCGSFVNANTAAMNGLVEVTWDNAPSASDEGTGIFHYDHCGNSSTQTNFLVGFLEAISVSNPTTTYMVDANGAFASLNSSASITYQWNHGGTVSSGVAHNWSIVPSTGCNTPPSGEGAGPLQRTSFQAEAGKMGGILDLTDGEQRIDSDAIDVRTNPPTHILGVYDRCGGTDRVNPALERKVVDFMSNRTTAYLKFRPAPMASTNPGHFCHD